MQTARVDDKVQSRATLTKGNVLSKIFEQTVRGSVFAYIDPGSGSFLLQAVVGAVAVVIVAARAYWRRSVDFVRRRRGESQADQK